MNGVVEALAAVLIKSLSVAESNSKGVHPRKSLGNR
jgi:hypothetical protein